MSLKCRICDNTEGNTLHKAREMMFGLREEFNYIECSECRCIQIEEVPEDLGKHYPSNYYSYNNWPAKVSSPWNLRLKTHFGRYEVGKPDAIGWLVGQFRRGLGIGWVAYTKSEPTDAILDVGCGSGKELNRLSERGYKNLIGIDPFVAKDIIYENGVKIYKKELDEMQGSFKTILLNHTFEHLPDPLGSLQNVSRLLQPNGTVVIRIPVSNCYAWEKYGVDWYQLDAPRHIFLHNEQTIALLAAQSGLKVTDVVYDSMGSQFYSSERYSKDIPYNEHGKEPPIPNSEFEEYSRRAAELNKEKRGDQATFYLTAV